MIKRKKSKRPLDSRDRLLKTQMAMYLDKEQAAALKALSKKTKVPQQVYIRMGLDKVLVELMPGYKPKDDA